MDPNELAALTARVRSGEAEAMAEFVRLFAPQIRRAIRIHGTGQRLQRVLDSEDLCQSVLRRFLGRLDDTGLPMDDPGKLLAYLLQMARNRQREALRRERADKRGGGRLREAGSEVFAQKIDPAPAVGLELEQRELLEAVLARLGEQEQRIARLRADGVAWEDIARQLGGNAEALRKGYQRAVKRAAGIEDL
jgi:RNA polymerase sigma factor (sigma-70 family)